MEDKIKETLLRTSVDEVERQDMASGRSLESKFSSLESSQRAKLVSILSSMSSLSSSDFETIDDDADDPAIDFRFGLLSLSLSLSLCFSLWRLQ